MASNTANMLDLIYASLDVISKELLGMIPELIDGKEVFGPPTRDQAIVIWIDKVQAP